MANKVHQSVKQRMRDIVHNDAKNINQKSLEGKQFNTHNQVNIPSASGQTPSVDVVTTGYMSMTVIFKATANASPFVMAYMKDGSQVQLDTAAGTLGTVRKFAVQGIDKVAVYGKDTSATANNKISIDVCLIAG